MQANVNEEKYLEAVTHSSRRGITVVLQRDINECMVNNYNGEWLRAWSGNMDIQICIDFFSVITYIKEYYCKDDTGTTSFLIEAAKKSSNLSSEQQRRCLKSLFLTHRQIGISEAFMKIFPEMRMKDSNIGTEFVPLGKPEEISHYLVRVDEESYYPETELFEDDGKEGLYYEKPNVILKYLRRGNGLEDLCLAQFVKMYDSSNTKQEKEQDNAKKDDEFDDDKSIEENIDREAIKEIKMKFGSETKFHQLVQHDGSLGKPLPSIIELINPLPNEPACMKKRSSPKALRFYKAKNDRDPSRFFLHELMLYKSFNRATYDGWCSDSKVCTDDYMKQSESIQKVKGQIMEWIENVEVARLYVEEVLGSEVDTTKVGTEMDAEMEQDILECEEEGQEEDQAYYNLNPNDFLDQPCLDSLGNRLCKQLQLEDNSVLVEKTLRLDEVQRKVLDITIKFVQDTIKASKSAVKAPEAPKLIVSGGAGAGKSTLINVMSQWLHKLLMKPGDDPESPYVIKTATTGAASVLIEGITLHSAMGFDFSNKHTSLNDKKRELRREQMKNTKIIIVDELSLMKPDLLYRLDLGLREIKQNNKEFGNCLVVLLGDLLQVR